MAGIAAPASGARAGRSRDVEQRRLEPPRSSSKARRDMEMPEDGEEAAAGVEDRRGQAAEVVANSSRSAPDAGAADRRELGAQHARAA